MDHPGTIQESNEDHRNTWGLPAKKMPKFAQEFGGQNRKLDPKLPAKKRLPQEMIAAGRNGYGWWWRSGLAWVSCFFFFFFRGGGETDRHTVGVLLMILLQGFGFC